MTLNKLFSSAAMTALLMFSTLASHATNLLGGAAINKDNAPKTELTAGNKFFSTPIFDFFKRSKSSSQSTSTKISVSDVLTPLQNNSQPLSTVLTAIDAEGITQTAVSVPATFYRPTQLDTIVHGLNPQNTVELVVINRNYGKNKGMAKTYIYRDANNEIIKTKTTIGNQSGDGITTIETYQREGQWMTALNNYGVNALGGRENKITYFYETKSLAEVMNNVTDMTVTADKADFMMKMKDKRARTPLEILVTDNHTSFDTEWTTTSTQKLNYAYSVK